MEQDIVLALVVIVALAFDFTNGFHDTANAMATSIAGPVAASVVAAVAATALYFQTQRSGAVRARDV